MKPMAYSINTPWAIITGEQALHEALRDRNTTSAALDVFLDGPSARSEAWLS